MKNAKKLAIFSLIGLFCEFAKADPPGAPSYSKPATTTVSTPAGTKTVNVPSSQPTTSKPTFSATASASGGSGASSSGSGTTKQVSTPAGTKTVSVPSSNNNSDSNNKPSLTVSGSSSGGSGASSSGSGSTKQISTPAGTKTVSVTGNNNSDSNNTPSVSPATKANVSQYTSNNTSYSPSKKASESEAAGYADYYKSKAEAAALAKKTGFNEKDYYPPAVIKDLYVHARSSYEKAGVPLKSTVYSKGPMENFAIKSGATAKDMVAAQYLDNIVYSSALEGKKLVVSPPQSKFWDIAKIGQEMTSSQFLGVKNSMIISGDHDAIAFAENIIKTTKGTKGTSDGQLESDASIVGLSINAKELPYNGQMMGGYILLDTAVSEEEYVEYLKHETQHAGLKVMEQAAQYFPVGIGVTNAETKRMIDSIRKVGESARIADLYNGGAGSDVKIVPKSGVSMTLQGKKNTVDYSDPKNYPNSIEEFLAYTTAGPKNLSEYAYHFSQANNIPLEDAKIAIDAIMNTRAMKDLNDDLNENAELVLKNMDVITSDLHEHCSLNDCGN